MDQKHINLPMSTEDIERCLPHRRPFLLIDEVTDLTPNKSIVAIKYVSEDDYILSGHFPGNPIFPGVLMVEGIAQAAGVLGKLSSDIGTDKMQCLLTEVSKARFRKVIVPGTSLRYEIELENRKGNFLWFKGRALDSGDIVATVTFSALMQ